MGRATRHALVRLLLVVGCCLVLAYRSLTAGLVTGRWSRDRQEAALA